MNKRTRVLKRVLDVSWIIGVLAALLDTFVFRDTGPISSMIFILLCLVIVGLPFYNGIESIQKAKSEGRDVPWWKESNVIFACGMALLMGPLPVSFLLGAHAFGFVQFFPWFAVAGIVVCIYSLFMQVWRFIQAWRRKRIASPDQEKKDM
jgi:hypothetical protein